MSPCSLAEKSRRLFHLVCRLKNACRARYFWRPGVLRRANQLLSSCSVTPISRASSAWRPCLALHHAFSSAISRSSSSGAMPWTVSNRTFTCRGSHTCQIGATLALANIVLLGQDLRMEMRYACLKLSRGRYSLWRRQAVALLRLARFFLLPQGGRP